MIDTLLLSVLAKMLTSAALVVIASIVVERVGPFFGAVIATLPLSAGPAYVFLAMEHGADFIAKSSVASLAVNAATALFLTAYAYWAQTRSLLFSLPCALFVWFLSAWVIIQLDWGLTGAALLNVISFSTCIAAARRWFVQNSASRLSSHKQWRDIPVRALSVMCLVGCVVVLGRLLGPTIAGIAALVPIVLTSLAIILHPRIGGPATATVLLNGLPGMAGMGLALAVLHISVTALGTWAALSCALAVSLCWNTSLILLRRKSA
jgi:uncharacterized membrane protein (GlpM family)